MTRILITDSVHPVCVELFEQQGYEVDMATDASDEEILERAAKADGWVIRSGTTITAPMMAAAGQLQVIGRAGVGVDNIDVAEATRRGVLVINAPDGNTISTAEHTCAMIMSLARRVPHAASSMWDGKWERKKFAGSELYGKTLGVIGIGKIGRAVAARMQSFGMTIVGFDPLLSEEHAEKLGIRLVSIPELLAASHFITVHTPLVDGTRNLLNEEAFASCVPGVRIINCARGGIVDEVALLKALESGRVAGAALDVFEVEPPDDTRRGLVLHPNVVTTPHIAASTAEAQQKVARQVAEQVVNALEGRAVTSAVNAAALSMASNPEARPFIQLAEKLGAVCAQLAGDEPVRKITVQCKGDIVRRYRDVLLIAVVRGVLGHRLTDPVNLINALALAEEAGIPLGIDMEESRGGYSELVGVQIDTGDVRHTVQGSVFSDDDQRIVFVDGYEIELRLDGSFLIYNNQDRPGMLASVGALLAGEAVNIGAMALGRKKGEEMALTAMQVDDVPSEAVMNDIRAMEGVEKLRLFRV